MFGVRCLFLFAVDWYLLIVGVCWLVYVACDCCLLVACWLLSMLLCLVWHVLFWCCFCLLDVARCSLCVAGVVCCLMLLMFFPLFCFYSWLVLLRCVSCINNYGLLFVIDCVLFVGGYFAL